MTLVAASIHADGFVISADSEIDRGDVKTYGDKITQAKRMPYELVIAGCGDEDYIDEAKEMILRNVAQVSDPTPSVVSEILNSEITRLYTRKIFPQWKLDDALCPQANLIVGFVSKDGECGLWKTFDMAVSPVSYFHAIGSGAKVADQLAGRLLTQNLPVAIAHHLVTQILVEGRRAPGVGGDIHTVSVRRSLGSMHYYDSGIMKQKSHLWDLESHLHSAIRSALETNEPRMETHLGRLTDGLRTLLASAKNGPFYKFAKFDKTYPVSKESDPLKDVTEFSV